MKIVLKILGGIGTLVALLLLLVVLCHLNPNLSKNIGQVVARFVPSETENGLNTQPAQTTANAQNVANIVIPENGGEGTTPQEQGISPDAMQSLYVAPDPDELKVDIVVQGLNGLEAVEDVGETITREEVKEIEDTLSVGESGEGLDWDGEKYPYYAMLNDSGKELYRQIYANMEAYTDKFRPIHDTNKNELKNAFSAVCNDQPQLFYIKTGYGYKQDMSGKIAEIDLMYLFAENQVDEAREKLEESAERIIATAENEPSDYDKEVVIHDALMDMNTYSKSAPMNQSAYSALVNGKTVCAGYARAFQYICMQMDIPCYLCVGYAGEKHAWNIIKLEDDYYNVDVTWDDSDPNTHDYFNCSDAKYAKDHIRRELAVYLPPCNGDKYSDLVVDPKIEPEPGQKPESENVSEPVTYEPKQPENSAKNKDDAADMQTGSDVKDEPTAKVTEEETPVEEEKIDLKKTAESVEEYYKLCRANLMASDKSEVTFVIKVKDKALWQDIRRTYQNDEYKEGYAQRVLMDKSKDFYSVDVEMKRLTGGIYEVTHKARIE